MNKKVLFPIILVIIVVASSFLWVFNKKYSSSIFTVAGEVSEVKDSTFVIQDSSSGNKQSFVVTDKTVFKKSVVGISIEQLRSGGKFQPSTIVVSGNISDLNKEVGVTVKANKGLLPIINSRAIEVSYSIYDFPEEI